MAIKRVLITGSNSYVGTNVEKWLMKEPDKFYVETISVRGDAWKAFDFSRFDVVFHVAGIAHVSPKKSMKDLYYSVNRDLAINVAKKAKESGVRQFIFMSSMIVYSSKETRITKDTIPNPDNFYGRSKLNAEEFLASINSDLFTVCILRTPLIYGLKSKGNLNKLVKFIRYIFIFPEIFNKRSIIHIHNFSNFIRFAVLNKLTGIFFPQNSEYFSISKFIFLCSEKLERRVIFTRFFNPLIFLLKKYNNSLNKLFSDFYYDNSLSKEILTLNVIEPNESFEVLFYAKEN